MKNTKLLTIILTTMVLFSACGKDKNSDNNKSDKTTTNSKVEVQTTIVEVTDATGEPVTNSKGEKVTEVLTVPTTAKKGITGNSNAIVESTTKSKTSETAKNSEKTTTTTAKPQPVTTQPTQPQNPYGYANAWGTLAQMENDCKAYAQSIGLIYKDDFNLGNGHWATPNSSYGASSPEIFKSRMLQKIKEHQDLGIGITTIRVLFVTLDNYKDGRCGTNPYVLEEVERLVNLEKDNICIYFITD